MLAAESMYPGLPKLHPKPKLKIFEARNIDELMKKFNGWTDTNDVSILPDSQLTITNGKAYYSVLYKKNG